MRNLWMAVGLFSLGCGSSSGCEDLASVVREDLAVVDQAVVDLSANDLSVPDLAVPDLTFAPDLAGVDLGPNVSGVSLMAGGSTTLVTLGAHVQLTATAADADGGVLAGEPFFWHSDSPGVASVDGNGQVTAMGNGTAVIHVTAGPNMAGTTITITVAVPVASVSVASPVVVADGKTINLVATAHDAANAPISGVSFDWMSTDITHAAVDATGKVSGVLGGAFGLGPIAVSATAETHSGNAQVSVAVYKTWSFTTGGAGLTIDVTQDQHMILANPDNATHSIVLDAGGSVVNNFGKGDSAARKITMAPGSYPFHCGVHGNAMTGTLVVH